MQLVRSRSRQLAALAAIAAAVAALALIVTTLWSHWQDLLAAVLGVGLAVVAAWYVLSTRGTRRALAVVVLVVALVGAFAFLIGDGGVALIAATVALALAAGGLARYALHVDPASLRRAAPPGTPVPPAGRPVLLYNPKSGGGKADPEFVAAAEARGIRCNDLTQAPDLARLAHDVIAEGADVVGVAGGDGSQAVVAGVAAEHDVAFVCIPAGTRNHFALDLGVDRDDVVGALDAFAHGFERRVDDAHPDLVLVSNNVYQLSGIGGFGARARLDEGVLGVIVIDVRDAADLAQLVALETAGRGPSFRGWHEWSDATVVVESSQPVEAGIDGEAVVLEAPVRFESRPAALRVRVAPHHPGVSPPAVIGELRRGGLGSMARRLLHAAAGRT
jgi:diacylglycerol kinase family enzyme